MEQKEMDEQNRQLKLIEELEKIEAFQLWRDTIAKPVLEQLEAELASKEADAMPEVILRAKLKYLNILKRLFYDIFPDAKLQRQINENK